MKLLKTLILLGCISFLNADLIKINDNIIKDTSKNFLWQDSKDVMNEKRTFANAVKYCKSLEIGEHKNWELPGFAELFSIVNTKMYKPTLSKEFKYFVTDNYWTSKTFGHAKSGEAFVVDFLSGAFNRKLMDEEFFVRCYKKVN
jgi:hypothetical protein